MWRKKWEEICDSKQELLQCTEKTFRNGGLGYPCLLPQAPVGCGWGRNPEPNMTITLQSWDSISHRAPQQGQTSALFRLSELLV